jgi:hypothetical protein
LSFGEGSGGGQEELLEFVHAVHFNVGDEDHFFEEVFPLVPDYVPVGAHADQRPEDGDFVIALELFGLTQVKEVSGQCVLDHVLELWFGLDYLIDIFFAMVLNGVLPLIVF